MSVVVFVVCAIACLVAHVAILVSVISRRSETVDSGVPRPRLGIEIVWALVPAIALAVVLTATWNRISQNRLRPPAVMKVAQ